MSSSAHESEWSENADHSDSGVPDWLAGDEWAAFADAHPEWYNPEQLALLDSDQRQWWQDRLDLQGLAPLPTVVTPQEDNAGDDCDADRGQAVLDPDNGADEAETAASDPEPAGEADRGEHDASATDGDSSESPEDNFSDALEVAAGDEERDTQAEDVSSIAHPDPDPSSMADTDGTATNQAAPADPDGSSLPEEVETEPQDGPATKARFSGAALWGRLTRTSNRKDAAEPQKEDEELDPYRPRFAVAPTWTRTASILLWATSGVCIVAAALVVAVSLSGGYVLSVPTPLLFLAAFLLGGIAILCILAGQGVARGYRTWFVAAVALALATLWSPLTALPLLLALAQRDTRDWVI